MGLFRFLGPLDGPGVAAAQELSEVAVAELLLGGLLLGSDGAVVSGAGDREEHADGDRELGIRHAGEELRERRVRLVVDEDVLEWPAALATARPLSVAVCVLTLVMLFQAPRFTTRVPPLVIGLMVGTALHFVFVAGGLGAHVGPVLGAIDVGLPDGDEVAVVMSLAMVPGFAEALPAIILGVIMFGRRRLQERRSVVGERLVKKED